MNKMRLSFRTSATIVGVFILFNIFQLMPTVAQERCATTTILQQRSEQHPQFNTKNFERWISDQQKKIMLKTRSTKKASVKIPVVFHIIHNAEDIGSGGNVSKDRIDRQLEILNEDFNRLNKDASETLDQFQDVAASLDIEFVYASQDPDGLETEAIIRLTGSREKYSSDERQILSAESYWPAEDYLNIWVADLSDGSIGWAEFPISNLEGLEGGTNNRLVDGITIDYLYFGDNPNTGDGGFESKGRTATHEMGHFFGLRHIWGDGETCSRDDYCEDTPSADRRSTGCNLGKVSCGSLDMVQNFMDYTNDVCMNIFTSDQKMRVRTVLENSPRRESLTKSKGLEPPPVYDYDLALSNVNRQYNGSCNGTFTPQITLKNQGLLTVSEYQVQLSINEMLTETLHFTENLANEETKKINFSLIDFAEAGQYQISYEVIIEEGIEDERANNNVKIEFYQKLQVADLPYKKIFQNDLHSWLIRNSDGEETWQLFDVGLGVPFFDNRQNFGEREAIISPIFDFSAIDTPELSFVFAQMDDSTPNTVDIYASYDCGKTFNDLIFSNTITDLSTAYPTDDLFTAQYRLDWDTLKIDLSRFKNQTSVSFSIVAENRMSNNFYLKEFTVGESSLKKKEIEILKWNDVNPITCEGTIRGTLQLKNVGREKVASYKIKILNNNEVKQEYVYNSEVLHAGQETTIALEIPEPDQDVGKIEIRAVTLAAQEEVINRFYLPFERDCQEELPPLRLSLRKEVNDNWFDFNPNDDAGWTYSTTKFAVKSNSEHVSKKQSEDWLVSPLVDVSDIKYLGLIFDVSYQKAFRPSEKLEIYISDVENKSFNTLIYRKSGDSLSTSLGNEPPQELKWRNEFIDLSPYMFRDKYRLAFKITHDNGHSIYLKNISLFVGQTPPPPFPNVRKPYVIYPNPVKKLLNLHLNLAVDEEGIFQILDLRAKVLLEFKEPKLLNQFVTFDVSALAAGAYILRLKTNRVTATERFIIQK